MLRCVATQVKVGERWGIRQHNTELSVHQPYLVGAPIDVPTQYCRQLRQLAAQPPQTREPSSQAIEFVCAAAVKFVAALITIRRTQLQLL